MSKINQKSLSFKDLLIKKREEKGILKKEVAKLFSWTPMYYGRYEKGNLKPSSNNIKLFADFLEISEKELQIIINNELDEKIIK